MKAARLSPLPDLGDIVFLLIGQFLLVTVPGYLFGDGSTGWHLITGRFICAHHAVPHNDLISYTFPGAPWVAYEWLSDLIMALAEGAGGLNGVAVLASSVIALVFLLVYERCRKLGMNFALALVLTLAGALASSLHWLARPHIWSFLGIYIFSTTLEGFRRGTISGARLVATLAITMALWVNLHPGFLMGLALVVIYLACEILSGLSLADDTGGGAGLARARWYALSLAAALVASLANPYGLNLYGYIINYLHGGQVIAATDEFKSPVFHGSLQSTCLELVFVSLIAGLVLTRKRPSFPALVSCLAFGHLALAAVRNVPAFVIVALPFVADLSSESRLAPGGEPAGVKAAGWLAKSMAYLGRVSQSFDSTERLCKMHLLPCAAVFLLSVVSAGGCSIAGQPLLEAGFSARSFPSQTLDFIYKQKLPPDHGFNYDNWGGYIRYKLGVPVFIDDRADFYGERFYIDYATVNMVCPGWQDILHKYKIEWVLVPRESALAARLKEQPDWRLACQDPAAVLFIRR